MSNNNNDNNEIIHALPEWKIKALYLMYCVCTDPLMIGTVSFTNQPRLVLLYSVFTRN